MAMRIMPALTSRAISHTTSVPYRTFSTVARRINFNFHVQWYSTDSSPRLLAGSPSAEDIRPGEPGYSLFMENALNYEETIKEFIKSKSEKPQSAERKTDVRQLKLIDKKKADKGIPQSTKISSESIISLLKEMGELKERVALLEKRVTKI